jgi:hypothetical protein
MNFPYLGCGNSRSISILRVFVILSDVTTPISVLRLAGRFSPAD